MKRDVNWSAIWFLFFTTMSILFAVLLMLRLTKEITISWWWVFSPLIAESFIPMVVVIIGIAIELIKEE